MDCKVCVEQRMSIFFFILWLKIYALFLQEAQRDTDQTGLK